MSCYCYRTIPENHIECQNYDCNSDTQYGMHENFDYYQQCKMRQRNKGLFTADKVVNQSFHKSFLFNTMHFRNVLSVFIIFVRRFNAASYRVFMSRVIRLITSAVLMVRWLVVLHMCVGVEWVIESSKVSPCELFENLLNFIESNCHCLVVIFTFYHF